jgi:hypothetical protein
MSQRLNLGETYLDFRDALEPLGISVGRDVIDLWRDREHHGRRPRRRVLTQRCTSLIPMSGRVVAEAPGGQSQ